MSDRKRMGSRISPRRLTELREERNLTIDDLARITGISARQLKRIEKRPERTIAVQGKTQMELAKGLDVEPRDLLSESAHHVGHRARLAGHLRRGRRELNEMTRKIRGLENQDMRLTGQIRRGRRRRDEVTRRVHGLEKHRGRLEEQCRLKRTELNQLIVEIEAHRYASTEEAAQAQKSVSAAATCGERERCVGGRSPVPPRIHGKLTVQRRWAGVVTTSASAFIVAAFLHFDPSYDDVVAVLDEKTRGDTTASALYERGNINVDSITVYPLGDEPIRCEGRSMFSCLADAAFREKDEMPQPSQYHWPDFRTREEPHEKSEVLEIRL